MQFISFFILQIYQLFSSNKSKMKEILIFAIMLYFYKNSLA